MFVVCVVVLFLTLCDSGCKLLCQWIGMCVCVCVCSFVWRSIISFINFGVCVIICYLLSVYHLPRIVYVLNPPSHYVLPRHNLYIFGYYAEIGGVVCYTWLQGLLLFRTSVMSAPSGSTTEVPVYKIKPSCTMSRTVCNPPLSSGWNTVFLFRTDDSDATVFCVSWAIDFVGELSNLWPIAFRFTSVTTSFLRVLMLSKMEPVSVSLVVDQ
jgi:hypothetical protein